MFHNVMKAIVALDESVASLTTLEEQSFFVGPWHL